MPHHFLVDLQHSAPTLFEEGQIKYPTTILSLPTPLVYQFPLRLEVTSYICTSTWSQINLKSQINYSLLMAHRIVEGFVNFRNNLNLQLDKFFFA